ncbi:hypothetical protein BDC45DRAFT_506751, partial [Circinella umbellata]
MNFYFITLDTTMRFLHAFMLVTCVTYIRTHRYTASPLLLLISSINSFFFFALYQSNPFNNNNIKTII